MPCLSLGSKGSDVRITQGVHLFNLSRDDLQKSFGTLRRLLEFYLRWNSQGNRGRWRRSGDHRPQEMSRVVPPPVEELTVGATNLQRAPVINPV